MPTVQKQVFDQFHRIGFKWNKIRGILKVRVFHRNKYSVTQGKFYLVITLIKECHYTYCNKIRCMVRNYLYLCEACF